MAIISFCKFHKVFYKTLLISTDLLANPHHYLWSKNQKTWCFFVHGHIKLILQTLSLYTYTFEKEIFMKFMFKQVSIQKYEAEILVLMN